jgi:hypothetical protein
MKKYKFYIHMLLPLLYLGINNNLFLKISDYVFLLDRGQVSYQYITRSVQWETGKVVLKIACTTDVIMCRVCEGSESLGLS